MALGIKGKLFVAMGALGAGTVIVGVVGWSALVQTGGVLDGVTRRELPRIVSTVDLQAAAGALVAGAPVLASARTDAERQRAAADIANRQQTLSGALDALRRLDQSEATREIQGLTQEMTGRVAALDQAVQARLRQEDQQTKLLADVEGRKEKVMALLSAALDRANKQIASSSMSVGGDAAALTRLVLRLVGTEVPIQQRLAAMQSDITWQTTLLAVAMLGRTADGVAALEKRFEATVEPIEESLDIVERLAKIEGLRATVENLLALGRGNGSVFAARRAGLAADDAEGKALTDTTAAGERLAQGVLRLVKAADAQAGKAAQAAESSIATSIVIMLSLAALSVLAGGLIAMLFVGSRVARPLGQIGVAMGALAKGDLAAEIPAVRSRDEIGTMAQALEVFKSGLAEQRRLAEAERQAQTQRAARAERLESLATGFDRTVSGTLDSVGQFIGALHHAAEQMSEISSRTNGELGSAATAAELASANVATVATAAEQLSSSIAEISRQVTQSSKIASDAVSKAERTNATVQGLAEAAQRIGEVVKLINDIAGQTNLLALNATIEAARAGDAGKGFAVVASEVKSLAGQTGKATEQIAAQIAEIQGTTAEAVKALRDIGGTIDEINAIATAVASAVEEQGAATQEIARNVQEAAARTRDVSANVSNVSSSADETGQAAGQVLSTAGELSVQTKQLQGEVTRFIGDIKTA
jgi:methyl-accepting chemotaxis protein